VVRYMTVSGHAACDDRLDGILTIRTLVMSAVLRSMYTGLDAKVGLISVPAAFSELYQPQPAHR